MSVRLAGPGGHTRHDRPHPSGAIQTGSGQYVNYLLPGILLITLASGIAYTAYRLFLDTQSGIFERLESMPIARSSVLWAHVLTSLVANPRWSPT